MENDCKKKENNVYITTPIYYVNGDPHIGHFYTSLSCDVLIRLYQKYGYNVRYLTGTDEHGQKVQQSAIKKGISPKTFCDEISAKFRQMYVDFKLIQAQNNFNNNTSFIRTTDEKHVKYVQNIWKRIEDNGWIYKSAYKGWYSWRDECFFTEKELIDGKAPTGAEVELREEECYFFRLSIFQKALYQMYKDNISIGYARDDDNCNDITDDNERQYILQPKSSLFEVLAFLELKSDNKLNDLCISRSKKVFDWGIEVPTDTSHTIYVWLDALFNYFSALYYNNGSENDEEFNMFWKNGFPIHVMGKEIIRFHAVYWPSLIYSLYHEYRDNSGTTDDNIDIFDGISVKELKRVSPKQIFAHGWWVKDGEKMSKSIGNVVNPYDEIKWLESLNIQHDVAIDYFRFFLISATTFGNDANYSRKCFVESINAHLVNNLGNLVQRVASMLVKNFPDKCSYIDRNFEKITFDRDIKNINFTEILHKIFERSTLLNQEFDSSIPWVLVKGDDDNKQKAFSILSSLVPKIISIVDAIEPFCPYISHELMKNLQLESMPSIVCNRIREK